MLKIDVTSEFMRGHGACLQCGYSCSDSGDEVDSMYEMSINHILNNPNHVIVFTVIHTKSVSISSIVDPDTVNLKPDKDRPDFVALKKS